MAQGDQYFLISATGEKYEVTAQMSVGRSADSDLVVTEGQPSRRHALIEVTDQGLFVEDLDSTNGTYVNELRISGRQPLADGDALAFDVNRFAVQVVSDVAEDRTVLRATPAAEDPNRTVLRPATTTDEKIPTKVEAPPALPSDPAPTALEQDKVVRPGSWADPNAKNASSTQFFSPEDLAALRSGAVTAAVQSDVPLLQVTTGTAAGEVIQLIAAGPQHEWTIGSDAQRDIVFEDQGVSEFHTILALDGGRWKLVDQMSTNGTFLNGAKTVSAYLNSGDRVRIGTVECTFSLPQSDQSSVASAQTANKGGSLVLSLATFLIVLGGLFALYYWLM